MRTTSTAIRKEYYESGSSLRFSNKRPGKQMLLIKSAASMEHHATPRHFQISRLCLAVFGKSC